MMTAMIVNMYFRALYPCTESFSSHNLRMHCIKTIYMCVRELVSARDLSCVCDDNLEEAEPVRYNPNDKVEDIVNTMTMTLFLPLHVFS